MKRVNCVAVAAVLLASPVFANPQAVDADRDDLDEVVVVGRSVATGIAEVEVEREMLVDTATVLKDIPGANVNANGPLTGIAQYRGMYGDRIAVVIDHLGVVSGGPNAMDAPLSYVSPMITESLSVTRGIASVSLAPESIGGHVATELSRGEFGVAPAALSGFAGTRFSSNGNLTTTAGRLTVAGETHKVSLIAELDDGDDIATPPGTVRPSRMHRERSDLSYAYFGERASVLLFAGRLDTDDTGTSALPMDIRFIDTDLAGAQLSWALNDRVVLRSRFAWNDVEHLMDNFALRQAPMPAMQRQSLTTGSGARLHVGASIALAGSSLDAGLDASAADHDATVTNPNNAMFRVNNFAGVKRDVRSAFLEWRRDGDSDGIEIGIRTTRVTAAAGEVGAAGMMGDMGADVSLLAAAFNAADRDLSWSNVDAVAKYRLQRPGGSEWRFEIGSKTRAPSYQELFLWLPMQSTGGLADGRSYVGGLGLAAERSNEITIGFGRQAGRVVVAPQFFYRRVDDYVQGVPSGNVVANRVARMMSGNPALEFANVDATIWGADIAWKVELGDRWYLDGIASWLRGERRDSDDNLYRLAPPNARLGLTRQTDTLSLSAEVVGYAAQERVSRYNGEQPTPGYGVVNAALAWYPVDALRVEMRVENLLDREYQDHVAGINRAAGSDIPLGVRLYGTGRSLSAGLIWRF
ncbi:MAG: TonB-dependent receptor [Gammaproteobacteria bacterium]|nr:TonB-dependent receptor [Gammaproteobacteria bacterium]NNF49610.1 TonB-dependent receptor [Woeseiaceae bacterium]MBT8094634.1 TonB-dependent receptor [Gammaproteobacteria bacterium]MBT8104620.1 TonB-dependent receptor [Gammaproteobacteria bacterium]NNK24634.1 TonB-dependent receptor [Woeseiaceae bacterium]